MRNEWKVFRAEAGYLSSFDWAYYSTLFPLTRIPLGDSGRERDGLQILVKRVTARLQMAVTVSSDTLPKMASGTNPFVVTTRYMLVQDRWGSPSNTPPSVGDVLDYGYSTRPYGLFSFKDALVNQNRWRVLKSGLRKWGMTETSTPVMNLSFSAKGFAKTFFAQETSLPEQAYQCPGQIYLLLSNDTFGYANDDLGTLRLNWQLGWSVVFYDV